MKAKKGEDINNCRSKHSSISVLFVLQERCLGKPYVGNLQSVTHTSSLSLSDWKAMRGAQALLRLIPLRMHNPIKSHSLLSFTTPHPWRRRSNARHTRKHRVELNAVQVAVPYRRPAPILRGSRPANKTDSLHPHRHVPSPLQGS